jgi:hypothetical protein
MKIPMIVLAVIAGLVTLWTVPNQAQTKAQPATTVAGFTLGSSCDIDAKLGQPMGQGVTDFTLPVVAGSGMTEKDVYCKAGKIESVTLVFVESSFAKQLTFLQEKYGQATWLTRKTEQNGFGATRSNNNARWNLSNGDSILMYEGLRADSADRSVSVTFRWKSRLDPPPNSKSPY